MRATIKREKTMSAGYASPILTPPPPDNIPSKVAPPLLQPPLLNPLTLVINPHTPHPPPLIPLFSTISSTHPPPPLHPPSPLCPSPLSHLPPITKVRRVTWPGGGRNLHRRRPSHFSWRITRKVAGWNGRKKERKVVICNRCICSWRSSRSWRRSRRRKWDGKNSKHECESPPSFGSVDIGQWKGINQRPGKTDQFCIFCS